VEINKQSRKSSTSYSALAVDEIYFAHTEENSTSLSLQVPVDSYAQDIKSMFVQYDRPGLNLAALIVLQSFEAEVTNAEIKRKISG
jgi:hypothetical protein